MSPPRIAPRPPGPREAKLLMEAADALRRGDTAVAEPKLRAYCAQAPSDPVGLYNLAKLIRAQPAEATELLERAVALEPRFYEAWLNLGTLLTDRIRFAEAERALREAVRLHAGSANASLNLAILLHRTGRIDEALAEIDRCLALAPDMLDARRERLTILLYAEGNTPESILEANRDVGRRLEEGVTSVAARGAGGGEGRRLRIGYISPDFRSHAVAHFFAPIIAAHDRSAVEAFCYAEVPVEDEVTRTIRGHADGWFKICGVSDDDVARRIAADRIDVLVDLAGHSQGNRLGVLARRPAPVQGTWIGYPATTGMRSVDFRITDAIADPPGASDALHTERLVRLAPVFLCFSPPADAGEPAPPPCLREGFVTFGSFNNVMKLSPSVVATWSRVLAAVPESRLLLKSSSPIDDASRKSLVARFAAQGVATGRVRCEPKSRMLADHYRLYEEVDIALDPWPYNGTTTTCEAMWMGLPVVGLLGPPGRHAARVTASLLHAVGMADLVAASVDDYVEIAARLTTDHDILRRLRTGMRARLRSSPLMDARATALGLETAYRDAVRRRHT
jgi:protein O-GlcNAc transferase